jgi:hypothetical protein
MQEVADQLETIAGLRVYAYPPSKVSPPAAVVTYPGSVVFDATYGRGMDRIPDLSVVALVGKMEDRSTRDLIGKYCNGSGPQSFKQVIEAGDYGEFDTLRVTTIEFDVISVGGVEHMAATFTIDIAGQGA